MNEQKSAYIFTCACFFCFSFKWRPKSGVFTISLNKCHHISLPHVGTCDLSCSGNVAIHQRDRRYHRVRWLVNLTHMACRPELWLAPRHCPAVQNMRAVADSVCLFFRYWRFPATVSRPRHHPGRSWTPQSQTVHAAEITIATFELAPGRGSGERRAGGWVDVVWSLLRCFCHLRWNERPLENHFFVYFELPHSTFYP